MEGQSGQTMEGLFGPPISVYTRKQALEDGQLVDVSALDVVREAGFRFPIAVTRGVWGWVQPEPMPACQDRDGRLHDVMTMLRFAIRCARHGVDRLTLGVLFAGGPGLRGRQRSRVRMIAICGPDDDGVPCLTVMLPGEE